MDDLNNGYPFNNGNENKGTEPAQPENRPAQPFSGPAGEPQRPSSAPGQGFYGSSGNPGGPVPPRYTGSAFDRDKPDEPQNNANEAPAEPQAGQSSEPVRPQGRPEGNRTYPYFERPDNTGRSSPYGPQNTNRSDAPNSDGRFNAPGGAPRFPGDGGQHNGYPYSSSPAPKKSGSSGAKVFIIILAVIVTACIAVVAVISATKFSRGGTETDPTTVVTEPGADENNAGIELQTTPEQTASSGTLLTAGEVYEKIKDSSVGILEYVNNKPDGEGSGIIMSEKDGWYYIVTCAHVISEKNATFMVKTASDVEYAAEMVGYDSKTDLGILRIEAEGLKIAEFGDSTVCKVGDTVYAIGNPGGLEFAGSFTAGIISAIDRPISSSSTSGYTMDCIQHDAAINPGNSGGALVNAYGQVIGINSIKIVDEEYEGMGFAIPITEASEILNELISNGRVANRAALGITYASISNYPTYAMYASFSNLPSGSIIIASINENGALADSEAQVGDMITQVNGKDLDDVSVLLDTIQAAKPGDTIELTLVRISNLNGKYSHETFTVSATLVEDTAVETTEPETTTSLFDYYFGGGDGYGDPFGY
ncbi:MAG: trypsin-like peptidase domain-containing protein [Clostridia bacterium]|nr:trypsin-like peptidase domain-containing protein [Clostridia bacterium]